MSKPLTNDPWLNTRETSELIHIAPGTLRYYKSAGKGPRCYKVGRNNLYKRSEVLAWMEAHAFEPSAGVA